MITVDVSGMLGFADSILAVGPRLEEEETAAFAEIGKVVVAKAQGKSSWSSRIPQTIHSYPRGLSVTLIAGEGESHPGEAAAYEHKGVGGTFRHPVYGNTKAWVNAQARPFMLPSVTESYAEMEALCERAAETAIATLGGGV